MHLIGRIRAGDISSVHDRGREGRERAWPWLTEDRLTLQGVSCNEEGAFGFHTPGLKPVSLYGRNAGLKARSSTVMSILVPKCNFAHRD